MYNNNGRVIVCYSLLIPNMMLKGDDLEMKNTMNMVGTIHIERTLSNYKAFDTILDRYKKEIDKHRVVAFERTSYVGADILDMVLLEYAKEQGKTLVQLDSDESMDKVTSRLMGCLKNQSEILFTQHAMAGSKEIVENMFDMSMVESLLNKEFIDLDELLDNSEDFNSYINKLSMEIYGEIDEEYLLEYRSRVKHGMEFLVERENKWDFKNATLAIVGNNHVSKKA